VSRSPVPCVMARTRHVPAQKPIKKVRPKLTSAQKESRRKKFVDLTKAIGVARAAYEEEATSIAETFGRFI
jgi:hypothetical protein